MSLKSNTSDGYLLLVIYSVKFESRAGAKVVSGGGKVVGKVVSKYVLRNDLASKSTKMDKRGADVTVEYIHITIKYPSRYTPSYISHTSIS